MEGFLRKLGFSRFSGYDRLPLVQGWGAAPVRGSVELQAWGGGRLPHSGASTRSGRQACRAPAQLLTGPSLGKGRVSYITLCPGWILLDGVRQKLPWVFIGYPLCARPQCGSQAGDQRTSVPPMRAAEKPLWLLSVYCLHRLTQSHTKDPPHAGSP